MTICDICEDAADVLIQINFYEIKEGFEMKKSSSVISYHVCKECLPLIVENLANAWRPLPKPYKEEGGENRNDKQRSCAETGRDGEHASTQPTDLTRRSVENSH